MPSLKFWKRAKKQEEEKPPPDHLREMQQQGMKEDLGTEYGGHMKSQYAQHGAVLTLAGGAGVGGMVHGAVDNNVFGWGSYGGMGLLGGVMGLKGAADARFYGNKKRQAKEEGNDGGEKLHRRNEKAQLMGVGESAVGTAGSGLGIANSVKNGSEAVMSMDKFVSGAQYTSSALGVAGAATGVAGNSIAAMHGMWKLGKSLSKWKRLRGTNGDEDLVKDGTMFPKAKVDKSVLTEASQPWRQRMLNRTKYKALASTLKIAAAGVGIAAGALVLASNPVGWAIGIGAGVVAGGMAIGKLIHKFRSKKKRMQTAQTLDEGGQFDDLKREAAMEAGNEQGGVDGQKKRVQELSNRVAKESSTNANVASQMIDALKEGDADQVRAAANDGDDQDTFGYTHFKHQVAHDAELLLKQINVTKSMALSSSGQDLIARKMSVAENV